MRLRIQDVWKSIIVLFVWITGYERHFMVLFVWIQGTIVLFVWIKGYERHFSIGILYAVRHAVYQCNLNFANCTQTLYHNLNWYCGVEPRYE